jgi:hypothetical protein
MEDILPYTCILEICPKPETFYMTKEHWLEHMSSDHDNSPQWTCRACSQKNIRLTFYSAEDLKAHLEGSHSKGVKPQLIPALLSAWQQKMPLQVSSCPLCSFSAGDDRTDILGHIAEHVHAFSLRSLPWAPREQSDGGGDQDTLGGYFKHHPYFEVHSSRSELSSDSSGTLSSDKDAQDLPALDFIASQHPVQGSGYLELTEGLIKEVPDDVLSGTRANNWLANLDLEGTAGGIPETPSRTRIPSEALVDASGSWVYFVKEEEGDDHFQEDDRPHNDEIAGSRTPADNAELSRRLLGRLARAADNSEALPETHMGRRIARRMAGRFRDVSRRTPVYENYAEFFSPEELRAGKAERQSPTMPTATETEPVLPLDAKINEATGDISWPVPELKLVESSRSISRGVVPEVKVFEPDTDSEIETNSKAGPPRKQ